MTDIKFSSKDINNLLDLVGERYKSFLGDTWEATAFKNNDGSFSGEVSITDGESEYALECTEKKCKLYLVEWSALGAQTMWGCLPMPEKKKLPLDVDNDTFEEITPLEWGINDKEESSSLNDTHLEQDLEFVESHPQDTAEACVVEYSGTEDVFHDSNPHQEYLQGDVTNDKVLIHDTLIENPNDDFFSELETPAEIIAEVINFDSDTSEILKGHLIVDPTEVDFGTVTVGCYSKTREVKILNDGAAQLSVKNVFIDEDCPSKGEFKIKALPPLPEVLLAGASISTSIAITYHPQDLVADNCNLKIESYDTFPYSISTLLLPTKSVGTFETEHTDVFEQGTSLETILFLSRIADPATVKAWVNGKECHTGWSYIQNDNSVVFEGTNNQEPCNWPQIGDTVKVWYKTVCFNS